MDAKDAKEESKERKEGADDGGDALFATLQRLEELLYAGVTVTAAGDGSGSDDDEEWNAAESKDALSFRDELAAFEARALRAFDAASAGGEYGLEHTELHGARETARAAAAASARIRNNAAASPSRSFAVASRAHSPL